MCQKHDLFSTKPGSDDAQEHALFKPVDANPGPWD